MKLKDEDGDEHQYFILNISVLQIFCNQFFLLLYKMVNFMCQFDWDMGYPDICLNIISRCVCEVFPEEVNI